MPRPFGEGPTKRIGPVPVATMRSPVLDAVGAAALTERAEAEGAVDRSVAHRIRISQLLRLAASRACMTQR